MPFYRWVHYLPAACLLIALVMPGAFDTHAHAAPDFSLEVRTWSCPAEPEREAVQTQRVRPEGCTPLDLAGMLRTKIWNLGTPSDAVDWDEVSITGSTTRKEGIEVNGSGAMVQLPAAPNTGSIAFLYGEQGWSGIEHGESPLPHGWIRYDTGEAQTEFTFNVYYEDNAEVVIDVLYLESPHAMVENSSITLHRWSCTGSVDTFDPATCSAGVDAAPYLWAGPNVQDNAPGRFPSYASDGPTGIYRDLDPMVYRFAAADTGLAGATISDRVLVIPANEPQEIDHNVFGPEGEGDTYSSFSVDISAEHPIWEFNVYEFPADTRP
jgi:hypothetical protein